MPWDCRRERARGVAQYRGTSCSRFPVVDCSLVDPARWRPLIPFGVPSNIMDLVAWVRSFGASFIDNDIILARLDCFRFGFRFRVGFRSVNFHRFFDVQRRPIRCTGGGGSRAEGPRWKGRGWMGRGRKGRGLTSFVYRSWFFKLGSSGWVRCRIGGSLHVLRGHHDGAIPSGEDEYGGRWHGIHRPRPSSTTAVDCRILRRGWL